MAAPEHTNKKQGRRDYNARLKVTPNIQIRVVITPFPVRYINSPIHSKTKQCILTRDNFVDKYGMKSIDRAKKRTDWKKGV